MNKLKKYMDENKMSAVSIAPIIGLSKQSVLNLSRMTDEELKGIKAGTYKSIKEKLQIDLLDN